MKTLIKPLLAVLLTAILSLTFWGGGLVWALESLDIPNLPDGDRTWVVDFGNVVSTATESDITSKLDELEKSTGKAVRFITVQRIDFGQPVEEFLQEVFSKWFPTPEAGKDQALLLIAAEDHRTAWYAGQGIESLIPPNTAQSIIIETMLPSVQAARFNQAIVDGAKRLSAVLAGEADPGPPIVIAASLPLEPAAPVDPQISTVWVIALLIGATIVPMATYFLMQR